MKKDFVWGVATAAFQIEGAAYEDGKTASIWDKFCEVDGKVFEHHDGLIACDHYHRYEEDIDLVKNLGISSYRFSVSWPRIIPDESGKVNEKGLDFYKRLVDGLLEKGVKPYMTLYHWDMPYWVYQKGGFANRENAKRFGDYTEVLTRAFGDRVKDYMTFNEPQCCIGASYSGGAHAPGLKLSDEECVMLGHGLLLMHGNAVSAIRNNVKDANIAIGACGGCAYPKTTSAKDVEAARKAFFQLENPASSIALYCDPVFLGDYAKEIYDRFDMASIIKDGDLKLISQKIDNVGFNHYSGEAVQYADNKNGYEFLKHEPGCAVTAMDWAIDENGIYWNPKFLTERYNVPVYITENGMANDDFMFADGKVHDPQRTEYLTRYLKSLKKAIKDGVDVRGYYVWSLMDNFEWTFGYSRRFGIVYVDYKTQQRTPKDSYYFYKKTVESNGENL